MLIFYLLGSSPCLNLFRNEFTDWAVEYVVPDVDHVSVLGEVALHFHLDQKHPDPSRAKLKGASENTNATHNNQQAMPDPHQYENLGKTGKEILYL